MDQRPIAEPCGLPKKDSDRGAVGDRFRVQVLSRLPNQMNLYRGKESSGACPAAGRVGFADAAMRGNRQVPSHYLTALMLSVSVPDGTLTVIRSPFFLPTSARPTGESTEIRPADGSLSTAPTRW